MFARKSKYKDLYNINEYINAIDAEIDNGDFTNALIACNQAVNYVMKTYSTPNDCINLILAKVKIINAMVNLQDKLEAKPKATGNDAVLFNRI